MSGDMAAPEPPPGPVDDRLLADRAQLEPFIDAFTKHGVDFLVIGGQAEVLMGSARLTYDVDFAYLREEQNLKRLAVALTDLKVRLRGAPPDLKYEITPESLALGNNYTFETSFGSFDILGYVEPVGDFAKLLENCETIDFNGRQIRTIGLGDLIRVKEHIRRDKDREALAQLYAIRRRREQGV
jgi:hypothetical protein